MRGKALLSWGLLLLWCGLIFWGTGDSHFTGESTQAVVAQAVQAAPVIGVGAARQIESVNLLLRKCTHVVMFAMVALLARWAIGSWPGARWRAGRLAGVAWLFTTLYAASDEWHQHFVPGRTASVWDVLLDSMAAAVMVLLILPSLAHYLGARSAEPRP